MPSTKEIKRRIRGIASTRQITKAMELVSTAKLRKARHRLELARPYYSTVLNNIRGVMGFTNINHPYTKKRPIKKILLIAITSDRGLAGGYNHNITDMVDKLIRENDIEYELIVIGDKAKEYFGRQNYEIVECFRGFPEVIEFEHAKMICEVAFKRYLEEEIDSVVLAYTRFDSTLQYTPMVETVLPFSTKTSIDKKSWVVHTFEPSPDEVLDYLIPKFVEVTIYGALIEASASEHASRRTAMESATDNADEMLEDLSMSYNRARQAAITSEISEIVSGANALQ